MSAKPHIYKKGKILEFKDLELPSQERKYFFTSEKPNIQSIVNQCNNINQIIARIWLKTSKITSYLGLEQDLNEKYFSKKSSLPDFQSDITSSKEIKNIEKLQKAIEDNTQKLEEVNENIKTNLLIKDRVTNIEDKLEEIRVLIKGIVGG